MLGYLRLLVAGLIVVLSAEAATAAPDGPKPASAPRRSCLRKASGRSWHRGAGSATAQRNRKAGSGSTRRKGWQRELIREQSSYRGTPTAAF